MKERTRKREKESSKRRGLVVLGNGEENPRVLFRDADQESKTRMRNNALRTGPRQAVDCGDALPSFLNGSTAQSGLGFLQKPFPDQPSSF
ncbi:hypothetical protein TNCV_3453601 [Trichonephila clavipes]|nr:hypothetical protein TNCV_3453601 [Trichonephila clavipes]